MNDIIHAFILNQKDYREKDVLLQVYSQEHGRLTITAAGARKMTSHNAGRILPCTQAALHIDYVPGKTIFRLKQAETIEPYRHIQADLVLNSAAAVLCDTMYQMSLEETGENRQKEWDLLSRAMHALDTGHDANTVICLYLADILKLFGSAPDADECTICGKKVVRSISVKAGGFLCEEHAIEEKEPFLPVEELKRFRLLCKAGMDRLDIVEKTDKAQLTDVRRFSEFLRAYTGSSIASMVFYEEVSSL
jgi:DNA repair protein RecO (recombination protein O)